MTPAEWAVSTASAQGLPEKIEDEETLAAIAGVIGTALRRRRQETDDVARPA